MKQRNPSKPIRIHIKIFCANCSETGCLHGFNVYEGAGLGSTADSVCELVHDGWVDTGKVFIMDNCFAVDQLTHRLHDEHGVHHITTSSCSSRSAKAQPKITAEDFPARCQTPCVQKSLPRSCAMTWRVERESARGSYVQHATMVNDTKLAGFKHNCCTGSSKDTQAVRRLRKAQGKSVTLASFEAMVHYCAHYGATDRFDAGMRLFPLDFKTQTWQRRLAHWAIDAAIRNSWILHKCHAGTFGKEDRDLCWQKNIWRDVQLRTRISTF